ncbi:MAG: 3-phosphoshikimate 1-carboxyvinyltransferase [Candidatus Melainabacteria bacterium]|nr:MAG: 3-phosphoshikimate 1-carboxyvinyltransferase [Candidatus Melainabacteria bacterium]
MASLQGKNLIVPGDKSITHRAYFFGAFSQGTSRIINPSPALDCLSTIKCLSQLGLDFKFDDGDVILTCQGINSLQRPQETLDAENSGTTLRLLMGLLAGRPFTAAITGDESLQRRPLKRVSEPLRQMGAEFELTDNMHAPVVVHGNSLEGQSFQIEHSSAQVQTAIILAGLQAEGETSCVVPNKVRNHTRNMLKHLDLPMRSSSPLQLGVFGLKSQISPFEMIVPGDISSAAYFIVAASLLSGSDISIDNLGIDPGRTLVLDILSKMGASIEITNTRLLCQEPVATVSVQHKNRLNGITIKSGELATGIDELPVLALAGAFCQGKFIVHNASELRHKESDRLSLLVDNLKSAGVSIKSSGDDFEIEGSLTVPGGSLWKTSGDHRLAMTGLIANLLFEQPVEIDNLDCIAVSYPAFKADLDLIKV